MHCDYLNITVPEDASGGVTQEVLKIVSAVGAQAVTRGLYKLATGGTYKVDDKLGFSFFSASGDMLSALRGSDSFASYLSAFASVPHRVSNMHVAHDLHGSDSPAILKALVKKARSGAGIKLTRKKLNPQTQVKSILSQSVDGRETGSVYLGSRTAEVRAIVYDKQNERLQRASVVVPPCTRFELSVSGKVGVSLRDAQLPDAVFWHFMRDVLPVPSGVPDWAPNGVFFELPAKVALLPATALKKLIQDSPQVEQMFRLADSVGPKGYEYMLRLINDQYQRHSRVVAEGSQSVSAAS
jgi:hypothetical protein